MKDMAWLDPPVEALVSSAVDLLRNLRAINEAGLATAEGKRMARCGTLLK